MTTPQQVADLLSRAEAEYEAIKAACAEIRATLPGGIERTNALGRAKAGEAVKAIVELERLAVAPRGRPELDDAMIDRINAVIETWRKL